MSESIEIIALVEGITERNFIQKILANYLAQKSIFIRSIILSKPGQKGGDVKIERVKKDIGNHPKPRNDTYVTLMIDFYGIKEWDNLQEARQKTAPRDKASVINQAIKARIAAEFSEYNPPKRFIPYVNVHEFEALLFSDQALLAEGLNVDISKIQSILSECGSPERINDSKETAPSKRLEHLTNYKYKKTITGIEIAQSIGIDKMRQQCSLFDDWLCSMEKLMIEVN